MNSAELSSDFPMHAIHRKLKTATEEKKKKTTTNSSQFVNCHAWFLAGVQFNKNRPLLMARRTQNPSCLGRQPQSPDTQEIEEPREEGKAIEAGVQR